MRIGIEHERAGRTELALPAGERPTGDDARQRGDVVLRIAATDAERMQFEDLAREVFVEARIAAASRRGAARERRGGSRRLGVVEIEQHRRMALDRKQQVLEAPEHLRADRFALIGARDPEHDGLVDRHREVVRPEVHEPLDEGAFAHYGRAEARLHFGEVDRPVPGAGTLDHARDRARRRGPALRFAPVLAQLRGLHEDRGRTFQGAPRREGWCAAVKLRGQPAPRVRRHPRKLARPGAEPETVRRDRCGGDVGHAHDQRT